MLIPAQDETFKEGGIIYALPERIRRHILQIGTDKLMEIRMRTGTALTLMRTDGIFYITPHGKLTKNFENAIIITASDIKRGLELITHSSVYAYEDEIRAGYITLPGGHRVGICGDAVTENGKIMHMRWIQSLNYRIAREIIGAADCVIDKISDGNRIKNTIIISPPMCGKTTLLRDIARQLSLKGKKVSITDERSEIAALSGGISPFDLGAGCDVLSGVNKADGMLLMLRSMSPDVIITDELGGKEDFDAIAEIKKRGVSIITSLHGFDAAPSGFDTVIRLDGIGKCLS